MARAGYQACNPGMAHRLGARILDPDDQRLRLDKIYQSEEIEEQGPPGPPCFGPRIMQEPAVQYFQLGRVTKPYNGSTKLQDWLTDYVSSVHIAGGNRRWAVRYLPHMLEGPARIWLNNLPAGSINSWMDLEEAFNSNFSSTYKRPNRPQLLAQCRQEERETDREYLTRWSNLRNTCERVEEMQAAAWFASGCRHGTPLWQRL